MQYLSKQLVSITLIKLVQINLDAKTLELRGKKSPESAGFSLVLNCYYFLGAYDEISL